MHRMLNCYNSIVNKCIINASHDANTFIAYLKKKIDLNLVTMYMI